MAVTRPTTGGGVASPDAQPLADLGVLELGPAIAGAFCGKLLGAFGAEVVKVEPPGGDPSRRLGPYAGDRPELERGLPFLYLNTDKLSVTLDPECPTGRALLRRLVASADVVVESLGPGRLEALGLPYGALAALAPGVILTTISDFGGDGPYVDYLGGELVLLALGGLLNMVGEPEQEPIRLGGYQAQYVSGLSAFTGTLAALHARDRTGAGQQVDVTVQESVAFVEWKSSIYYQANGKLRRRGGRDAQWTVLRARDGFVAFVYQDDNWPGVVELIGDPRLADERFRTRAGRLAAREELRGILEGWTEPRAKLDVYHTAQAHGIPTGLVADVADLLASPQYAERHYFETVDHPSTGAVEYPGLPCSLDGARPSPGRAPLLGEHNRAIYGDRLALGTDELLRLRERGVI
jgi:crotonobetainyl-CoA:carnitine CoA-transferase CaiB-like acyl-CoA transferase